MKDEKLTLTGVEQNISLNQQYNHSKIMFHNRYGITFAADMYVQNISEKLPTIAVAGPIGAVKKQAFALYVQTY